MSASITRSLTVDRPIGAVGRYLVDFAHSAQWGPPHIASCTRVDDGPIRVGARYRTVAAVGPLTETIEQTVVEYDTERRIVVDGRSRYLRTRDELTCTPVLGGGTCVTYTALVELVGRARVGAAALGPFLALAADQGAERLRRTVLEAVPAPHPDRRGGAVPLRGVAGCPAPAADDGRGPAV